MRPAGLRLAALALALTPALAGLAACGSSGSSGPSATAIASKLGSEPDFSGAPKDAVACIAGVLKKYEPPKALSSYVNGPNASYTDLPDPQDTNGAESALQACETAAAG